MKITIFGRCNFQCKRGIVFIYGSEKKNNEF